MVTQLDRKNKWDLKIWAMSMKLFYNFNYFENTVISIYDIIVSIQSRTCFTRCSNPISTSHWLSRFCHRGNYYCCGSAFLQIVGKTEKSCITRSGHREHNAAQWKFRTNNLFEFNCRWTLWHSSVRGCIRECWYQVRTYMKSSLGRGVDGTPQAGNVTNAII